MPVIRLYSYNSYDIYTTKLDSLHCMKKMWVVQNSPTSCYTVAMQLHAI